MKPTETQNIFNFIDYKIPIGNQIQANNDDNRSSYTRAHQNYIHNEKIGDPPSSELIVNQICRTLQNKEVAYDYTSETRRQYKWKEPNRQLAQANLAIHLKRPHFAKSMQEKIFQAPPKPIMCTSSYATDYSAKSEEFLQKVPAKDVQCPPPEPPKTIIHANQPGHYKYMDPYATTNMLSYPMHDVDQQNGIARKDYITVWDWYELPKGKGFGLERYPVKRKSAHVPVYDRKQFQQPIYDRIVPNVPDIVPHNGMTSESKANYCIPVEMKFQPNIYDIQPHPIDPTNLITGRTEYTIYGSGDKVNKFLKQNE